MRCLVVSMYTRWPHCEIPHIPTTEYFFPSKSNEAPGKGVLSRSSNHFCLIFSWPLKPQTTSCPGRGLIFRGVREGSVPQDMADTTADVELFGVTYAVTRPSATTTTANLVTDISATDHTDPSACGPSGVDVACSRVPPSTSTFVFTPGHFETRIVIDIEPPRLPPAVIQRPSSRDAKRAASLPVARAGLAHGDAKRQRPPSRWRFTLDDGLVEGVPLVRSGASERLEGLPLVRSGVSHLFDEIDLDRSCSSVSADSANEESHAP